IGILSSIVLFTVIYALFSLAKGTITSREEAEATPTPYPLYDFSIDTPTPDPSPIAASPQPSKSSVKSPTVTRPAPTNTSIPAVTATPIPTNTPQPTATPTRTPNPPIMNISYPQEAQYVEFTSPEQQLCVADVPAGGNTEELERRHNQNDSGWSSYVDIFTYCYVPPEGSNRIQFQYKNAYGDESTVYTRQFNFHKAY
ncbi:MAG: hypothetical protein NUV98_01930, partial [Candidatus Roizmanbacteria bacterium]|nr:hypothetical protein [Candidatus Roizmanbacteria bacterium]